MDVLDEVEDADGDERPERDAEEGRVRAGAAEEDDHRHERGLVKGDEAVVEPEARAERGGGAEEDGQVLVRRVHELERVLPDSGRNVERQHADHHRDREGGGDPEDALERKEHGVHPSSGVPAAP